MRKPFILCCFFLVICSIAMPLFAADPFEDNLPIKSGMKLKFIYIVAHMEQKDRTWTVEIVRNSFPNSVTYKWYRPQKGKGDMTGTRILTDLKLSRNFNPLFKRDENEATTDTAPWISQQILHELRERSTAVNFREGGTGAINWAARSLDLKEKILFPVIINGKLESLRAFRLNKGMVVWNNMNNPLVLEYEPLSVPLFTSITGWKLVSIEYKD
ncbi:MAG TPA: hypothetical protein PLC07_12300 [Bacillota bacterium]|nr:hypothetical protein [Bacillota bacterium]HPT88490.1 hypothetical protein [Bacillota bacterium]